MISKEETFRPYTLRRSTLVIKIFSKMMLSTHLNVHF